MLIACTRIHLRFTQRFVSQLLVTQQCCRRSHARQSVAWIALRFYQRKSDVIQQRTDVSWCPAVDTAAVCDSCTCTSTSVVL